MEMTHVTSSSKEVKAVSTGRFDDDDDEEAVGAAVWKGFSFSGFLPVSRCLATVFRTVFDGRAGAGSSSSSLRVRSMQACFFAGGGLLVEADGLAAGLTVPDQLSFNRIAVAVPDKDGPRVDDLVTEGTMASASVSSSSRSGKA